MDSLVLMRSLFAFMEAHPNMRWETEDGMLVIRTPISSENEEFLAQGRAMWSADDLS